MVKIKTAKISAAKLVHFNKTAKMGTREIKYIYSIQQ
jgi:hypothetical protein